MQLVTRYVTAGVTWDLTAVSYLVGKCNDLKKKGVSPGHVPFSSPHCGAHATSFMLTSSGICTVI
jgi:hypothetical protein